MRDGRPEYQYAALLTYAGQRVREWLPTHDITESELAEAMEEANAVAKTYGKEVVFGEGGDLIEIDAADSATA